MSRIKLRVSAGVFEVSLVRVLEDSCSVEVLWDRGLKREFKWGSVVFGNMEGVTIGQKPSTPAPEPDRAYFLHFWPFFSSLAAAAAPTTPGQTRFRFAPLTSTKPTLEFRPVQTPLTVAPAPGPSTMPSASTPPLAPEPATAPQAYPPAQHQHHVHQQHQHQQHLQHQQQPYSTSANYQYTSTNWRYHYPQIQPHYVPQAQSYAYSNQAHQPYTQPYTMYAQAQSANRGLQWQRPYTGPKNSQPPTQTIPYYAYSQAPAGSPGGATHQWSTAYNAQGQPATEHTIPAVPTTATASPSTAQ